MVPLSWLQGNSLCEENEHKSELLDSDVCFFPYLVEVASDNCISKLNDLSVYVKVCYLVCVQALLMRGITLLVNSADKRGFQDLSNEIFSELESFKDVTQYCCHVLRRKS